MKKRVFCGITPRGISRPWLGKKEKKKLGRRPTLSRFFFYPTQGWERNIYKRIFFYLGERENVPTHPNRDLCSAREKGCISNISWMENSVAILKRGTRTWPIVRVEFSHPWGTSIYKKFINHFRSVRWNICSARDWDHLLTHKVQFSFFLLFHSLPLAILPPKLLFKTWSISFQEIEKKNKKKIQRSLKVAKQRRWSVTSIRNDNWKWNKS